MGLRNYCEKDRSEDFSVTSAKTEKPEEQSNIFRLCGLCWGRWVLVSRICIGEKKFYFRALPLGRRG